MSGWPTGDELELIRDDLDALLDGTAQIISYTNVPDGLGGWTRTPSGTVTVACDLWSTDTGRAETTMVGGRVVQTDQLLFTFPAETTVGTSDTVRYEGVHYEVVDVLQPTPNEWERRVIAMEIS